MINPVFICTYQQLNQQHFLTFNIELREQAETALVFCFKNQVYAYLNRCVHMHRALTCQQDAIFDDAHQFLRCSMHGFVFEPETGKCLSPVCLGQQLHKLKLKQEDDKIYFVEKHLILKK